MESRCPKCGADLHTCRNCRHFDTAARFECSQPIKERMRKQGARRTAAPSSPPRSIVVKELGQAAAAPLMAPAAASRRSRPTRRARRSRSSSRSRSGHHGPSPVPHAGVAVGCRGRRRGAAARRRAPRRPAAELEVAEPVEVGATAPDFTLPDTAGAQVRLSDFAGKAILLTFWSCYTDTCFTTVKVFEELLAKLGPLGLVAPTVCEEIPPALAADNYAGLLQRCSTGQKILVDAAARGARRATGSASCRRASSSGRT